MPCCVRTAWRQGSHFGRAVAHTSPHSTGVPAGGGRSSARKPVAPPASAAARPCDRIYVPSHRERVSSWPVRQASSSRTGERRGSTSHPGQKHVVSRGLRDRIWWEALIRLQCGNSVLSGPAIPYDHVCIPTIDEMVLETAVNAKATAIVTCNIKDFGDAPGRFGRALWTPAQALRRISS